MYLIVYVSNIRVSNIRVSNILCILTGV